MPSRASGELQHTAHGYRWRESGIAQEKWEERFAWPADDKPPYPPLTHRVVRAVVTYLAVMLTVPSGMWWELA